MTKKSIEKWEHFCQRVESKIGFSLEDIEIDVVFPNEDPPKGKFIAKRAGMYVIENNEGYQGYVLA